MANTLANLARMYTETTGTGTLTLTTAVPGFNTFALAGITDGQTITYAIYCGPHREIGRGVYTSASLTLTRGTVYSSTNGGSKISLTGRSEVFITAAKEDFDSFITTASVVAGYQPLDAQLTDVAGLTPTDSGVIVGDGANFVVETGATLRTSLGIREKLTANRTYYVRTDGSDSNTGLADTAGGAFLTIQAAITAAYLLDFGGYVVTIQVRDGTYTGAVSVNSQPPGATATDPLILQGNVGTPANCIISTTSQNAVTVGGNGELLIQGFKLQTITSGMGIQAIDHSRVYAQYCEFGSCVTAHMEAKDGAEITIANNYTISGGSICHLHCTSNGYIFYGGGTITLTGTPAFSSYFVGVNNAHVQFGTTTFSGSATGLRYYVHNNASIYTNGAYSATYFPGNTAGVLAGGSCIDDYDGTHVLANTGLQIDDTDASHQLTIKPGSNLTADRVFTLTTGDAARTLDISAGSVTVSTAGAALIDDADASAQRTTLGLGTAATQNTGTSGATLPLLNGANTWSATQTVEQAALLCNLDTAFGAPLSITSSDASASRGPNLGFRRTSPSPAANDDGGAFLWQCNDDALAVQTYATIGVRMTAVAAGAISGRIRFQTSLLSAFAERGYFGAGFVVGGPTGGDKGVGTINAVGVYDDSALLCAPVEFMKSGTVNTATWDAVAIDVVEPDEIHEQQEEVEITLDEPETKIVGQRDGTYKKVEVSTKRVPVLDEKPVLDDKGDVVDTIKVPRVTRTVTPGRSIKRRNELAHEFKAMLDEGFDPRDPKAYFDKMLADEALPGLKTKDNWVPNEESNAKRTNRVILALELQTAVVKTLYERLEALEAKVKK